MALAERFLATYFNRPNHPIIDHYCYGICGDGDMMEGVASEAASLAGHLKLGKLIYLYDSNRITIDGSTDLAFTEDVGKRFAAYGWHVQHVDGYDLEAIAQALRAAQAEVDKPSLIIAETNIAKYSPNKQDSSSSHGAPLGEEEVKLTKQAMNWPLEPTFYVPEEAQAHFLRAVEDGQALETEWQERFAQYEAAYPDLAREFAQVMSGELPAGWTDGLPTYTPANGEVATRSASGAALQVLAKHLPTLLGGSADLSPSNSTTLKGLGDLSSDNFGGRNVHFGVREHGMGAILNGMALHGGIIPYGATFLTFADYMRPPMRLAALMKLRVIYVFTHDSIAVGEDGPTHQPIAHLASLRAIPNMTVIRPADANETVVAWKVALAHTSGPTCLVLSRQNLPVLDQSTLPRRRVCARAPTSSSTLRTASRTSSCWGPVPSCRCVWAPRRSGESRRQSAGRQHAQLRAVQRPAAGIPRPGAAARHHRAAGRGSRSDAMLVPLHRIGWRRHWDGPFRRISAR